jgi:hypothetical protein
MHLSQWPAARRYSLSAVTTSWIDKEVTPANFNEIDSETTIATMLTLIGSQGGCIHDFLLPQLSVYVRLLK